MSYAKWQPFCLGLDVLNQSVHSIVYLTQLYFLHVYGQVQIYGRRSPDVDEETSVFLSSLPDVLRYGDGHRLTVAFCEYREISNISRTKSVNLNEFRLVLQLSLPNSFKPGVKKRMKM